uniref:Uncharacterized protein n=1 Tax=Anguilla anguilla TaxID=7936 RepID=A0A0E9PWQ7_ANGAN
MLHTRPFSTTMATQGVLPTSLPLKYSGCSTMGGNIAAKTQNVNKTSNERRTIIKT